MTGRALVLVAAFLATAPPAAALPYERVFGATKSHNVLIELHGGGWIQHGTGVTNEIASRTPAFARRDYRVVSADYAPGTAGLPDVLAVYDAERARSPTGRICLYGESAGGQWALILAARRATVDCVISAAGPADLLQAVFRDPLGDLAGYVRAAFGRNLAEYDPVRFARTIQARLLLEFADDDTLVPPSQGVMVQRLAPHAQTVVLAAGKQAWIHSYVKTAQLRTLAKRTRAFLAGRS